MARRAARKDERVSVCAGVRLAMLNEAVADAGADGQEDETIVASSRAVVGLAQRGRADVGIHDCRRKLGKPLPKRDAAPRKTRRARDLSVGVHELGHSRADAIDDVAQRLGLTNEIGGKVQRVLKHLVCVAMRARRDHAPRQHQAIRKQHQTAGRFRTADVHTDSGTLHSLRVFRS